jgi:murein L,D-transpeptidase YcbB/YkuD
LQRNGNGASRVKRAFRSPFPGVFVKYPSWLIFLAVVPIAGCHSGTGNSLDGADAVAAQSLQSAAKDPGVRTFYAAAGWQAVWSKKAEKALGEALAARAAHGLDRVVFLTDAAKQSPEMREAGLTKAALGYASALAKGVVDPKKVHKIYDTARPDPNLAAGLLGALQNGKLQEWFDSLAPQDAEYRALSTVYRQMRQGTNDQGSAAIPDGKPIHAGQEDARVPRIAAALHVIGYLEQAPDAKATRYTPAMADALRRFQHDNGDKATGVVTDDTLAELNTAPGDRARATAVAMDRLRWLVRTQPATRIDVNTASATLTYVRPGQAAEQRRVVVGQPGWETPPIEASLYRLVANPTWTVPKSIEDKEMSNVSPGYLAKNNMVRKDGHIVQQPGPDNSLGLVKFDLDDPYAIYLHDTPAKSWFATDTRHRSHGCVRVQDALGFAQQIARDETVSGEWQKARASGKESFVKLPKPIAVRLFYHPTWVDDAGKVHFEPDIYGWDEAIAAQLGFGPGRARRLAPPVNDVGP